MTTSPISYLQTLANDEAIAFTTSLQSLKAYLSQELQWLNEQVQQKTMQLQGIEAILFEALALEPMTTADPNPTNVFTAVPSAPITTSATQKSDLELPAAVNGRVASSESIDLIAATIAALPDKTSSSPYGGQGKSVPTKPSRASKPAAKASAAKRRSSNSSASRVSQTHQTGLSRFLQSQFRGKALTESVSDILDRASSPLSTDEMMAELYEGLSQEDYQRAKHSLANILSLGKSKGVWKSAGRGRYAGNTSVITA